MSSKRWTLRVLITSALVAVALPSAAQDLRVRYFAEPGYGGEGMPYRDCSLGDEFQDDSLSDAPARLQDVDNTSGLSREEIQAVRDQIYALKSQLITELDELLGNMPPDYPRRADVMFRQAEALKEMADADQLVAYRDFTECVDNWYQCVSDSECYEPMPDYGDAIEQYRAVARNHPSYERIDEVVFRLGETLMENDAASEGIQFLTRLVNTYPDSRYIPDARILMADHYFDNDLLIAARQNYDEALNFPEASTYNYAIYKVGWVDLNEYAFEDSLARFQEVVSNLDMAGDPQLDFRRQALNDMLKCYVEIDDGWIRARDYYEQYEGVDLMRQQLERLGNLYDDQGKDEDRVALLDYFINRFDEDPKIPQWAEGVLASLTNIGDWDRYEQQARNFIDAMDANGSWALKMQRESETRALTNARGMTESWLLGIITRNFQEAERLSDREISRALYVETAADYEDFLRRFSDSNEVYDQTFFYAELMYYKLVHDDDDSYPGCDDDHYLNAIYPSQTLFFDQDGNEVEAGGAYEKTLTGCEATLRHAALTYREVVEMRPDPEAEHTLDSALGYLGVADDFMLTEQPDIDAPLPPPGDFPEVYDRDGDGQVDAPEPIEPYSAQYVDAVEWFAGLFPEHEDIPPASWRAAKIYLYAIRLDSAAERFETIIAHHGTHRLAFDAALASFVCYNAVEDWPRIESVARMLLDVCADSNDDICDPNSLQAAIAYAMNNQAEDLMEAGDALRISGDTRGANAQYLQAAEKRVALYREFPDSEWSPLALFGAAATYEQAREVDTSLDLYLEFITRYNEHEMVPEAVFVMGLIEDSQANFQRAATLFERINNEFPEYGSAPYSTGAEPAGTVSDAVYNAARLREAMSQFDVSIEHYDRWIELNPGEELATDVAFVIANIEWDRDNFDAAHARFEAAYDMAEGDQVRRLAAIYSQAKIRESQGRTRDANAHFERVVSLFGAGEAEFNEDSNEFVAWTTEPGMNFADEAERNSVRPFAVEAMWQDAEAAFLAAREADLEFPSGRYRVMSQKIETRLELVVTARNRLDEIANAGDAKWAVAAASRLGRLAYDFYVDIFNIPAPDYDECLDATNYNYDACDAAFDQYDETIFNIGEPLRATAEAAWAAGRRVALENQVFNEWTLDLMTNLNDLDPSYQVGVTEGFEVEATGDPYLATGYILDLQAKLDAFADFVEAPAELGGMSLGGEGAAPLNAEPTMTEEAAPAAEEVPETDAAATEEAGQ